MFNEIVAIFSKHQKNKTQNHYLEGSAEEESDWKDFADNVLMFAGLIPGIFKLCAT